MKYFTFIVCFYLAVMPSIINGAIIKNDFVVHNDTIGGTLQLKPAIAMNRYGRFVVCWNEGWGIDIGVNGEGWDIYARIFDADCVPLCSLFRVNQELQNLELGGPQEREVAVDIDNNGNFVVAWVFQNTDGSYHIHSRLFNFAGTPLTDEFRVDDLSGDTNVCRWYVAITKIPETGNFIVTWQSSWFFNGQYYCDIYGRRYNADGSPLGSSFRANEVTKRGFLEPYLAPRIDSDASDNFIVVWQENAWDTIWAQLFDSAGIAIDSNFIVAYDSMGNALPRCYQPDVAMNDSGYFVIVWEVMDYPIAEKWNIYAQRFDMMGNFIGESFPVNEDYTTSEITRHQTPCVAMDISGSFVIDWLRWPNPPLVWAQMYNNSGLPIGRNIVVFEHDPLVPMCLCWEKSIAKDAIGNWIVLATRWYGLGNLGDPSDLDGRKFDADGIPQDPFPVLPQKGCAHQERPAVAISKTGNYVITFQDLRDENMHHRYNVYARLFDRFGEPVTSDFLVHNKTLWSQWAPSVAMDANGNFVITWVDQGAAFPNDTAAGFEGGWIYARHFDSTGAPTDTAFRVSENYPFDNNYLPDVSMDADGDFVIVWYDCRNGLPDIYGQRYDKNCNPQDTNFKVNDYAGNSRKSRWPAVTMNDSGYFMITWTGRPSQTLTRIYAKIYDYRGNPVDTNFVISSTVGNNEHTSISCDDSSNFVITWTNVSTGLRADYNIYGQRLDLSGNMIGNNFLANDDATGLVQDYPSVTMNPETGEFAICWTDYRNGTLTNPMVYAQHFEANGNPVGSNFRVHLPESFLYFYQITGQTGVYDKVSPHCLASSQDRVVFSWMDTKRQRGWDVISKLTDWDIFSITETNPSYLCSNLHLKVSPNPVKGLLILQFFLAEDEKASICLYDVSGRLVYKTFSQGKVYGLQETTVLCSELSSGVYFVVVKTETASAKEKIIIVR